MLEFSWPWLFILLPLPLLWRSSRGTIGQALKLKPLVKLAQVSAGNSQQWRQARSWIAAIIWLCLVVAAAEPRWVGEPVQLPQQGRDIMLVIDLSGSMEITDMTWQNRPIDRVGAVQRLTKEFLERRQGDRVGLILFADAAYQLTPLTLDLATVQSMLDEVVVGMAGRRTAIGEGIGLAVKRFNELSSSNKVIVFLSDGASNTGNISPEESLQLAKAANVRIHTVGIGAEQMTQQGIFGPRTVNPSHDLDEPLLQRMAAETGGEYFRARNIEEFRRMYQLLDELEPIERESLSFRPQRSLVHWPLAIALLLSLWLACITINWQEVRQGAR
ncbi:VWA domain-containing protein [Alkalimonas collagenimarina]|uniref:VWA domain-containing protein n=1 Tax=Alkalimonas collagenimarina TaxID=400390 RepID=A0ABT9GZB8_9GAMM|nr:VWA domain-containing protein [Alkalimonas collagenimarina]MDP4536406.1 VWA domain-containing protein [Alkalimonas collagenimarina]